MCVYDIVQGKEEEKNEIVAKIVRQLKVPPYIHQGEREEDEAKKIIPLRVKFDVQLVELNLETRVRFGPES